MTTTITLPNGHSLPALGQGTWNLGDDPGARSTEIDALRAGIDLGLTMIDTAEMYGHGASEDLVGEAIRDRRDDVFIISKVLPSNASRAGTVAACERSLGHLGTDRIDLYLLHWRGGHPLAETVDAFAELVDRGLIGGWGVSNFDVDDLDDLAPFADVAGGPQTNQVFYNLEHRGIEFDLVPRLRADGVPLMVYSPVDHGGVLSDPTLRRVAEERDASPAQVALAWVLQRQPDALVAIKAGSRAHVQENAAARDIVLTDDELAALDSAHPGPSRKVPLEMR